MLAIQAPVSIGESGPISSHCDLLILIYLQSAVTSLQYYARGAQTLAINIAAAMTPP
ncbi:MAG: hypothetical protein R2911_26295 [Caldilineaceae bacterium]